MSLDDFCQKVSISDVFEVLGGAKFPREIVNSEGIRVIRGRDVARAPVSAGDLETFRSPDPMPDRAIARVDDILIQRIGAAPSSMLVSEELQGCLVGDTVIILRPRTENAYTKAISQYLSSAQGRETLSRSAVGSTIPQLSVRAVSFLEVPVLPPDLSTKLEESERDEQRVRNFSEAVLSKRETLFRSRDREEFESLLEEINSLSTVITSSLLAAPDLRYQLRNFYPLPLAYPYRAVEAEFEPLKVIGELNRAAEGFTAFLASIALALIPPPTGDLRKSLRRAWGGKGATFGSWSSILGKTAARLDNGKGNLSDSVRQLVGSRDNPQPLANDIQWLVDRRDEFHHKGWPVGGEADALIGELRQRFEACLRRVNFLLQHPLRLVLDYDAVRNADHVIAKCLDYSGDHPVCRIVQEQYKGIPKKQDLYILQNAEEWIPLYPFISAHYCPRCGTRETFFIDSWSGPGEAANLKSFERLHDEVSSEIGEALTRWFRDGGAQTPTNNRID